jgi:hypothetical protein
MKGISFSNWLRLNESNNNLLKAVIMMGGTGAGKSYAFQFFQGQGFHPVQSDRYFLQYLQQAGVSSKNIDVQGNSDAQDAWDRASNDTTTQMQGHMESMQPLVYETTGQNPVNVFQAKKALDEAGYDVYGVYITAPLSVAQQRNAQRQDRSVARSRVKEIHGEVRNNAMMYRQIFGGNWFEVNNDGVNDAASELQQIAEKIASTPVKNRIGAQKLQGVG